MERYFYRRGERVAITEVDGVLAVQVDPTTTATVDRARLGAPATLAGAAGPALQLDDQESQALAAAGWIFVRPQADTAAAMATRMLPDELRDVNRVFQDTSGHVLIGTQRLIVQFAPTLARTEVESRVAAVGARIVRELRFAPNQFEVEVAPGADLLTAANALQESEGTIAAEPNFVEFIGQRLRPTDPAYAQQWHLRNTGGSGGVAGADIAAEAAWDFTRGAGVRVAVIDNGFDVAHADLAPGLTAECGFFDASGTFRQTLTGFPNNDHGTFCAGMAAARHNNGQDGCGSAPEARLTLVASQGDQVGTQATLARAVAYAADPSMEVRGANPALGADVIVSSLGPNGANWALTTVLANALVFAAQRGRRGRGTPIFWASSNGNNVDISLDQVVSHPDVIAVGRSRRDDTEDNSARGPQLDFLAPGVSVVSTAMGGGTRTATGTSFAAPLAAGVGALVVSVNPNLTAREVCQVLRDTCDKIGGVTYGANGHHGDYGHGRVNAFRAVVRAMQTIAVHGVQDTDVDGDRVAEIPIQSPWGIGILKHHGTTLSAPSMVPNGTRIGGWLLNTGDNEFQLTGDFDGDGQAELFVSSPWGVGVLNAAGGYTVSFLHPNGTRFGGWLLNTADNWFGPVGDFDGDGRDEILVRSPWGIGILKDVGGTFDAPMMAPNGTRFGGWLLNTADNGFGPVGDFDGDGRDEWVVYSPWGLGILKQAGSSATAPMMAPNGTRFGGWLLNTGDNWFGPAADLDGDRRKELVVASPWGLGVLKLSGSTLTVPTMAPNGTRFGGWLLNTFDNRIWAGADFDGDGRAELLITSPWGIGVLRLSGTAMSSVMLAPNGTRFGGWLLNTADNQFRRFSNMLGTGRSDVLVESPWGIGILSLSGGTFTAPVMAPNGTRFGGWLLNTRDNQL